MSEQDIENEVNSRVEFKLNEILTSLENHTKLNWSLAFHNNSVKHTHYYEAFNQIKTMITKEITLPVPYDNMYHQEQRTKRDQAIDDIVKRFSMRGEKDYQQKVSFLVGVIERLQK